MIGCLSVCLAMPLFWHQPLIDLAVLEQLVRASTYPEAVHKGYGSDSSLGQELHLLQSQLHFPRTAICFDLFRGQRYVLQQCRVCES